MFHSLPSPKIRHGAKYYDLLNSPGTTHLSSCIFNSTHKYTLADSTFSIQAVTDSYKYGSELQFVSWSRQPPILERRSKDNSGYYRFEAGYMPLTHESAQQLRDVADMIDTLLYQDRLNSVVETCKFSVTDRTNLAEVIL